MFWFIWVLVLSSGVLSAQQSPAQMLGALQEEAQKKSAAWEALASDSETRVAHVLPCDPRAQTAIEEVSRASEARLAALSQYLEAKRAKNQVDAQAISSVIARQDALTAELTTERAEAEQERAAMDAELADISENAKQSPSLAAPRDSLNRIAVGARERVARSDEQLRKSGQLADQLRVFGKLFEERQKAIDSELRAVTAETARWREYYAARLGRAQTECSVINGGAPPRSGKK